MKGRACEVRLGQREGNSYGKGGRGMRNLRSSNISNPRTSRDWLQLEPLVSQRELSPFGLELGTKLVP